VILQESKGVHLILVRKRQKKRFLCALNWPFLSLKEKLVTDFEHILSVVKGISLNSRSILGTSRKKRKLTDQLVD